MKVLYGEGLVNHAGPESCVASREGAIEALTGGAWAGLLSHEKTSFRVPTLSRVRKATPIEALSTSLYRTLRGPQNQGTCTSFLHGNREIPTPTGPTMRSGPRNEPHRGHGCDERCREVRQIHST